MNLNVNHQSKVNDSHRFTVFVGVYNGARYLDSLLEQIVSQTNQNFKLLVIDNNSSDTSWNDLQAWRNVFGPRIDLHRNSTNLGGGGSMHQAISRNLINTEWLITLHQDDYYLPHHVATLIEALENTSKNIVAACTSMGSIDNFGNLKSTPPRAQWLVKDSSPTSSFLINLRTQTLSFPSAAFRYIPFAEDFGDWHSPTFSDTELTLKLCASGEFLYIQKETMRYRENPVSESHVIDSFQSNIGASLGLARVFTSNQFQKILSLVEVDHRGRFYEELISSIEVRLNQSALTAFIKLLATDECCKAWNFNELESARNLAQAHASLNSEFTSALIGRLAGIVVPKKDQELLNALQILSNQRTSKVHALVTNKKDMSWALKFWRYLPLRIRAWIFRIYVHLRAIKQPNFYWNSFWR